MNKRDWGMFGIGAAIQGAVVAAVLHSLFLLFWNAAWLGYGIYVVTKADENETR